MFGFLSDRQRSTVQWNHVAIRRGIPSTRLSKLLGITIYLMQALLLSLIGGVEHDLPSQQIYFPANPKISNFQNIC
jgi:hypothetical protein